MPRILTMLLLLVCAFTFSQTSQAATPKNALGAIAVSPDGRTILAAGDNRVLYVIDASQMTVRKRVWIGVNPLTIHYSADGSTFVLHDTRGSLKFYNVGTFKINSEISGVQTIAIAEKADVIFTAGRPSGRNNNVKTPLRGYALISGKPVLDKSVKVAILGLGVDADAKRIFAMSKSYKTDTEVKQKPPSNLRGLEREIFKQRNDGKAAQLVAFDLNGNELGRHTSWFSSSMPVQMISMANALRVVSYNNVNAEFTLGTMATRVFQSKNSYNYGIGYSVVNNRLATGGLANGTMMHLDNGKQVTFKIGRIGGWPEYFKGFAVAKDGTIYGGTTAYRLIRIGPDGSIKAVPVY